VDDTRPLTDGERTVLSEQLVAASRFVADYGSGRHPDGLDAVDHAWASWLDRQVVDPEDPDAVILAVGAAFGQALVAAVPGLDWAIAIEGSDEAGELAVAGSIGGNSVVVYLSSFVAKRYHTRSATFLADAVDEIAAEVERLRRTP
jgi:hypothetical protein